MCLNLQYLPKIYGHLNLIVVDVVVVLIVAVVVFQFLIVLLTSYKTWTNINCFALKLYYFYSALDGGIFHRYQHH